MKGETLDGYHVNDDDRDGIAIGPVPIYGLAFDSWDEVQELSNEVAKLLPYTSNMPLAKLLGALGEITKEVKVEAE